MLELEQQPLEPEPEQLEPPLELAIEVAVWTPVLMVPRELSVVVDGSACRQMAVAVEVVELGKVDVRLPLLEPAEVPLPNFQQSPAPEPSEQVVRFQSKLPA